MARKDSSPSRDRIVRFLCRATALGAVGLGGGSLLGMIAVGQGLRHNNGDLPSFADLSANPDAHITAVAEAPLSCPDCADSYGVAARLRAEQEYRMSESFRRLGDVDADLTPPPEPAAYRYGGRLPDPAPREAPAILVPTAASVPSAPVAVEATSAREESDSDETPERTTASR